MDSSSNNNWLTLLRRKIHKKFKRNRQKSINNNVVEEVENQISETTTAEEVNHNEEQITAEENIEETANESNGHNSEDMKKELSKLNWYWPCLSRIAAQKILSSRPNGSFLVRDSTSEQASFTLSFRTNSKTFHCRNQWSEVLASSSNKSIIDVIEETIKKSHSQVVGYVKSDMYSEVYPIAVRLIYPVVRENLVPSLQNLCLSLLARNVNESNINSLPLPSKIKEYVRENYKTL